MCGRDGNDSTLEIQIELIKKIINIIQEDYNYILSETDLKQVNWYAEFQALCDNISDNELILEQEKNSWK